MGGSEKPGAVQGRGRADRFIKVLASFTAVVALVGMIFLRPTLEESFTLHMIYHMILLGVLAPSLLAAEFFLWWIPPEERERWSLYRVLRRGFSEISQPVVAFTLSTAVLWFWHIPVPYDITLVDIPVHTLEHISILIAFLAYWAPLMPGSRLGLPTIRTNEGKALYLLAGAMQGMILGVIITFQSQIIYLYPSTAHLPGITLLEDQQMGGAVMWLFGAAIYTVAAILSFRSSDPGTQRDASPARATTSGGEE